MSLRDETFVPIDDGNCFVCGSENPSGLQLQFERVGNAEVRAEVTLAEHFQGWKDFAHGGIAIALLDEAMAHAAGAGGSRGLTASVNARFRHAVPLGEPLLLEGRLNWRRRNVLGLSARLCDAHGRILVEATGHFVAA